MAKYCGYCGAKMPDHAKVCGACGRPFAPCAAKTRAAETSGPECRPSGGTARAAEQPSTEQRNVGRPENDPEAKHRRQRHSSQNASGHKPRHMGRNVIAGILAAVMVLGVVFLFPKDKTVRETAPDTPQSSAAFLSVDFTDRSITDEASAREAIRDVSDRLGITSVQEELGPADRSEVLGDTYYSFQQMYQGIPVYGRNVVVSADTDGNTLMLSSGYSAVDGLDTVPKISEEKASEKLMKAEPSQTRPIPAGLVIYALNGAQPQLSWTFYHAGQGDAAFYFVSARNGEILHISPRIYTAQTSCSGRDLANEQRYFECEAVNGTYVMQDTARNITVYDADNDKLIFGDCRTCYVDENGEVYLADEADPNSLYRQDGTRYRAEPARDYSDGSVRDEDKRYIIYDVSGPLQVAVAKEAQEQAYDVELLTVNVIGKDKNGNLIEGENQKPLTPVCSKTAAWNNPQAVTAMTRTATAYDFYKNILHRNSFDGTNGSVQVVFDDAGRPGNAGSGTFTCYHDQEVITIGTSTSMEIDVVAHEFTHGVQREIYARANPNDCLDGTGESGAICEAVSDIFAELCEDYDNNAVLDGDCDWILDPGKKKHIDRNHIAPEKSKKPKPYVYQGKNWADTSLPDEDNDYGGIHTNCTVLSHAAWLMTQPPESKEKYESLTTYDLARLFYKALYGISKADINFKEFRSVVTCTANAMCQSGTLTAKQAAMVDWAMNKVAIPDDTTVVPLDTDSQDHHYQIFHETLSWQEAKQKCEAMGGHLAVITSAEEQQVIEDLNVQQENLWIGASRDESGAWAWVTGEPWSYTNWNEGEPNNSSNVAPNETCAAVWPKGWNDLANDNLYEQSGYICEWDGAQEPVVMDSGRLKRGVYVSSQDPGNTLTVHQVDGDTAIFTVFWPRIASIDHAEATFQGTMGDFYYLDPSGGYHAAGQIVDHLDGTLVLTLTDSDLPYVPVGTAETYVLDETQAVEDWEPADSSNGILTEEQLENLKISLGVPEDMPVQYLQSDLSYWPSGRCWEVYIQILHEGNAIAMASVDPGSGEATRNILAYSGAEYPASISNPQPPASLIGDWKLDENEHSRVEYIDFKQNGEVTVLYSTGEMETAPYRIESAGIVVTGQNTVHYYYMDGADLYLSEDLDRPALLYHLRE